MAPSSARRPAKRHGLRSEDRPADYADSIRVICEIRGSKSMKRTLTALFMALARAS